MTRRGFFIILIVIILAGLFVYGFFLLRGTRRITTVSASFVEQRNAIAQLLRQLSAVPDTDLSRLSSLETRRDWRAALQLMTDVVAENAATISIIESLVGKTRDLIAETQRISDGNLREQALTAMVHLGSGNDNMLSYFRLRSKLFRALQQYYADAAAGKPYRPLDISVDLAAIDAAIARANASYALFRASIEQFDRVAGLRYQGALLFLS